MIVILGSIVQLQVIFIRIPKIIAKILAFVVLSVLHDLRQYTGTIDVHCNIFINEY
jgi:hypothetical protein